MGFLLWRLARWGQTLGGSPFLLGPFRGLFSENGNLEGHYESGKKSSTPTGKYAGKMGEQKGGPGGKAQQTKRGPPQTTLLEK